MENKAAWILIIFLAALSPLCTAASDEAIDKSIKELISEGDKLDGQKVRVRGWIEIESETFRFWESEVAMKDGGPRDECVGVVLPEGLDRKMFDEKHVVVTGTYISDISGKYVVLGGCKDRRFIFIDKIDIDNCDNLDH